MTHTQNQESFLTVREVASMLQVSEATVLRWLKSRKLPGFFQIGRRWHIRRTDFDNYLNHVAQARHFN